MGEGWIVFFCMWVMVNLFGGGVGVINFFFLKFFISNWKSILRKNIIILICCSGVDKVFDKYYIDYCSDVIRNYIIRDIVKKKKKIMGVWRELVLLRIR